MNTVTVALNSSPPLTPVLLSELGKGSLKDFLRGTNDEQISEAVLLWNKLVSTAKHPRVVDKHITAASNALGVFLTVGVMSSSLKVRKFALSKSTWFDAFRCAHRAFDEGKTKPAVQILEVLCGLLQQLSASATVREILECSALPLVATVLLASPRSDLKKACSMLSCLLRKTPMLSVLPELTHQVLKESKTAWNLCLSQHNISIDDPANLGQGSMAAFFLALIFAMVDLDTRTSALKLYSNLCSLATDVHASDDLQSLGERAIEIFLDRNHASLGYFAENVLPVIINDKAGLLGFLAPYITSCRESESRLAVFLAALKVGRSKGVLAENEMLDILNAALPSSKLQEKSVDRYHPFKLLAMSASPELRVLSYALLTVSAGANTVASECLLRTVLFCMRYLHDDADAHERGEILSITRRLLRRIHGSHTAITRSNLGHVDEITTNVLASYQQFSISIYNLFKSDLGPNTSYQRHTLSLLSLRHYFDSAIEPDLYLYDIMLVKDLASLTLDPFEDVRISSAALLKHLTVQTPELVSEVISRDFIDAVSRQAIDTLRGDHADGMGRLWDLWDALQSRSDKSQTPSDSDSDRRYSETRRSSALLAQCLSVTGTLGSGPGLPVHGSLLAVSYCLKRYQLRDEGSPDLHSKQVLDVCIAIWNAVKPVLCVDSPETAYETDQEGGKQGPKDLLAYSWRALRDSSLLLQSLLTTIEPKSTMYSDIGDVCLDQLTSLRHRGAFSTVAQTFSLCCDRARVSPAAEIRGLLQRWYRIAVQQIDEQSDRLTRRSAGLPAMLSAILSPSHLDFFSSAVLELIARSDTVSNGAYNMSEPQKLPQVHALNCLKELLTNSKFATVIVQHLHPLLALAASSLSSQIWAIRNCGLMLLKACINRLDSNRRHDVQGVLELRDQSAVDSPSQIALSLLSAANQGPTPTLGSQMRSAETIFAALDLLGHTILADEKNEVVDAALSNQLAHPNWSVRDHAALLLSTRLSTMQLSLSARILFNRDMTGMSQNEVHGILLCFRYLFKTLKDTVDENELDRSIADFYDFVTSQRKQTRYSPYIEAAILDVLNDSAGLILEKQWRSRSVVARYQERSTPASHSTSTHAPYLRCRQTLFKILNLLLGDPISSTESGLQSMIDETLLDMNSLGYILEMLSQHKFWPSLLHGLPFLARWTKRLSHETLVPAEVLVAAMKILVNSLEHSTREISADLTSALSMIDMTRASTREGTNAGIRLEAFVLAAGTSNIENGCRLTERFQRWMRMVEFASLDMLDFPTRWSAARALFTFFRLCRASQNTRGSQFECLRLKLIIHTLLNDDDEDVRLQAVGAAQELLRGHGLDSRLPAFSAMAARENLLKFIVENHGRTQELAEVATSRIMLSGENVDENSGMQEFSEIFCISFSSRLEQVSRAKDDLFAEERQNLYVDDIKEIEVWTQVLADCVDAMSKAQVKTIAGWTSQGLTIMSRMLAEGVRAGSMQEAASANEEHAGGGLKTSQIRKPTEHPFGPTYDPAILVLFVKVISIAGVLLTGSDKALRQRLLLQLQEMDQVCNSHQFSTVFVTALKRSVNGQSVK